jgi:hypothetical protein
VAQAYESRLWQIRVALVNGEVRQLQGSFTADEAAREVEDFQRQRGRYSGDWLDTTEATTIARAHIVEISTAPLS